MSKNINLIAETAAFSDGFAVSFAYSIADKLITKYRYVAERAGDKIPYTAVNGVFDNWTEKNICWWTNGFWGGLMWQLYSATGEDIYKKRAEKIEELLDADFMISMGLDHDNGFKWLPTSGADFTLTGREASLNRLILAADNLLGRFNIAGNFFRAWNDDDGTRAGWAIIDCMMNLPLLYRASDYLSDPRYRHAALRHADTAMKYFVREDGSVNHIVEFDPETGEFVKTQGGQGMETGSTWTRGEAWAVYGFTLSYMHTGLRKYLDTARKCADFFIKAMGERSLVPVDF